LPGLIPGSHLNRGLGIQFLKHVERCAALLFLLDLAAPEPWTHLEVLQFELSQFNPNLLERPQLVVGNKLDLPQAKVMTFTSNPLYGVRKNPIPKLHEVIEGTKTKISCQGTVSQETVKLGVTKVGNEAKPLKYSGRGKKKVFRTSLEQMFKCVATKLDTQLMTMQQRLTCVQSTSQLFFIPLAACLESHLFQKMNTEPHKYVYCSQIDINVERFTWAKLADFQLAYSAVYGNCREVKRVYKERFPNTECPDYRTFASVNCHLQETGTLAVNRHSTE